MTSWRQNFRAPEALAPGLGRLVFALVCFLPGLAGRRGRGNALAGVGGGLAVAGDDGRAVDAAPQVGICGRSCCGGRGLVSADTVRAGDFGACSCGFLLGLVDDVLDGLVDYVLSQGRGEDGASHVQHEGQDDFLKMHNNRLENIPGLVLQTYDLG